MTQIELIDTHAHLDFPDYDSDRSEVVARAREAGITRIITVGTDLASQAKNAEVVAEFPDVYQAVGLHPSDSKEFAGDETIAQLRAFASDERVVAIGEIGLDWARKPDDEEKARQEEQFRAQIRLARDLQLPIILHSRAAEADCARILRDEVSARPFQGGVAHCYTGPVKVADELIQLGFLVSISGIVTFENAPEVHELARHLPIDKIVLETDCPFLAPERGSRNEPAAVRLISERVAGLRGATLEEIAAQTTRNAIRIFKLPA